MTAKEPSSPSVDRRSLHAAQELRRHLPVLGQTGAPASDPEGLGLLYQSVMQPRGYLELGYVLWSGPGIDCYNVQLASVGSSILCGRLNSSSSVYPFGAKEFSTIPPGTDVLVFRHPSRPYGVIVGVVPSPDYGGHIYNQSDLLLAGFVSGLWTDPCHRDVIKRIPYEGDLYDFLHHRPKDITTAGEQGLMTPTGVGLLVNDAEAFLRVNEICGLFLNTYDSYTKLAGWNMDIDTAGHQRRVRLDEGEVLDIEGFTPFYWEGLGFFSPNQSAAEQQDGQGILFGDQPLGAHDLPEDDRDRVPFWRSQIYRGYLGQGELRYVSAPPQGQTGSNRMSEKHQPIGLSRQYTGLDGSIFLQSAKQIVLSKRCIVPVPIELELPESKNGDSANNYKPSNEFGSGEPLVADEWAGRDEDGAIKSVAGVRDLIARLFNWSATHPFARHKKDWQIHEESKSPIFSTNQQAINIAEAAESGRISRPDPVKLDIAPGVQQVEFFENESLFALLDDGGVVLADAYGASISMVQGQIVFDAPGGVHIRSGGTSSIQAGDDLILKAKQSIDLSATEQNVSVKAQRSVFVLAGNDDEGSGVGGIHLESRGQGYDVSRTGENVILGGISLKSKGPILANSSEMYLRTGGDGLTGGSIVLDADKGNGSIVSSANQHLRYGENYVDAFGAQGSVRTANVFSESAAELPGALTVRGTILGLGTGVSFAGEGSVVVASGHFASSQAKGAGGQVAPLEGVSLQDTSRSLKDARDTYTKVARDLTDAWKTQFREYLYKEPSGYGSRPFQRGLVFTFRDDPEGQQYGTKNYLTFEPRWMGLARDSGYAGTSWKERPVKNSGQESFPYPGGKALKGETLLQYTSVLTEKGVAKNRGTDGGPYQSPSMEDSVKPVVLNENWKALG